MIQLLNIFLEIFPIGGFLLIIMFVELARQMSPAGLVVIRGKPPIGAEEIADQRDGAVGELIDELRRREKRCDSAAQLQALQTRRAYFETHRARVDYPRYESMNLPIGSVAIEGTCKHLIKGRMDCVGQRWDSDEGIENMTVLRTRIFNKKFDDLWEDEKTA